MTCPICCSRKPKRFCPAEGEKICAVCCGTGRENTIDCPAECAYLIAAHRYESEQRRSLAADQLPYPEIRVHDGSIEEHEEELFLLGQSLLQGALETRATDEDAIIALTAMVETTRTLQSGILYERVPDGAIPRQLYSCLAQALEDIKGAETERFGFPRLKDGVVIALLVLLLRIGKQETNGRRRSRSFLAILRSSLGPPKSGPEPSRIVTA